MVRRDKGDAKSAPVPEMEIPAAAGLMDRRIRHGRAPEADKFLLEMANLLLELLNFYAIGFSAT